MPSGSAILAVYFVLFGAVHSVLADKRAKKAAGRLTGLDIGVWYRPAYVVLSSIMVLPFIYILVAMPGKILYKIPFPLIILTASLQILSAIGMALSLAQTGFLDFFGLSQLFKRNRTKKGNRSKAGRLITTGFYCHLRNPLFLFGMIIVWLMPVMTLSLLVFNIMASLYFFVGALHEERSLLEEFGQAYRDYKRRVPMFIPRVRCS